MNLDYSIYRSNEWQEVNEFIKVLNKKLSRPCDEWTVLVKNSNKLIAIFQFWTYSFYKKVVYADIIGGQNAPTQLKEMMAITKQIVGIKKPLQILVHEDNENCFHKQGLH